MMRLRLMLVSLLMASVSLANAGTVTLFDGTFNDSDYDVVFIGSSNRGGGSASTFPVGGNPGAFRNIRHAASGSIFGSNATVWNISTTLTYDPSADGAIESFDYSEDNLSISGTPFSGAVAVRQDGLLYRSISSFDTTNSTTTWSRQETPGLTASDFELHFIDPGTGQFIIVPSAQPDFSENGSILEFGFWRRINLVSATRNGGLDNLRFEIATTAIPEPSTALLILSGFAAAFGFRCRRLSAC